MSRHKTRKSLGRRSRARNRVRGEELLVNIMDEIQHNYPEFKVKRTGNVDAEIRPVQRRKGKYGQRIYMDVTTNFSPKSPYLLEYSVNDEHRATVLTRPPSRPAVWREIESWLKENSSSKNNPSEGEVTGALLLAWGLGYIVGKGRG